MILTVKFVVITAVFLFSDCGIGQFKCVIGGGCISEEYVCDGIEQCADRSDEWNCMKVDHLISNSSDINENNTNKYLMVNFFPGIFFEKIDTIITDSK